MRTDAPLRRPLPFCIRGRRGTIHTENSHKYTIDGFRALASEAGFTPRATWCDANRLFQPALARSLSKISRRRKGDNPRALFGDDQRRLLRNGFQLLP